MDSYLFTNYSIRIGEHLGVAWEYAGEGTGERRESCWKVIQFEVILTDKKTILLDHRCKFQQARKTQT